MRGVAVDAAAHDLEHDVHHAVSHRGWSDLVVDVLRDQWAALSAHRVQGSAVTLRRSETEGIQRVLVHGASIRVSAARTGP